MNKNYLDLTKEEVKCHVCGNDMIRRSRKFLPNKIISGKQKYFYTEWDYCPKCHAVMHYEKFKVFSNTLKGVDKDITISLF